MRYVHISHDPVVIAHARDGPAAGRTDVEGAELPDGVALANDEFARLARVFLVLRNRAQRIELEDAVVAANGCMALDHAMRANGRAGRDLHMRTDHGVRPHADRAVEFGARVHQGCGMDEAHVPRQCCAWCT